MCWPCAEAFGAQGAALEEFFHTPTLHDDMHDDDTGAPDQAELQALAEIGDADAAYALGHTLHQLASAASQVCTRSTECLLILAVLGSLRQIWYERRQRCYV